MSRAENIITESRVPGRETDWNAKQPGVSIMSDWTKDPSHHERSRYHKNYNEF